MLFRHLPAVRGAAPALSLCADAAQSPSEWWQLWGVCASSPPPPSPPPPSPPPPPPPSPCTASGLLIPNGTSPSQCCSDNVTSFNSSVCCYTPGEVPCAAGIFPQHSIADLCCSGGVVSYEGMDTCCFPDRTTPLNFNASLCCSAGATLVAPAPWAPPVCVPPPCTPSGLNAPSGATSGQCCSGGFVVNTSQCCYANGQIPCASLVDVAPSRRLTQYEVASELCCNANTIPGGGLAMPNGEEAAVCCFPGGTIPTDGDASYCCSGLIPEGGETCGMRKPCTTGPAIGPGNTIFPNAQACPGNPWVVCFANSTTAFISSTNTDSPPNASDPLGVNCAAPNFGQPSGPFCSCYGGTYDPLAVCNELGYPFATVWGGTFSSVCGFNQAGTSCENPGLFPFEYGSSVTDRGGNGNFPSEAGYTIQWLCSTASDPPLDSVSGACVNGLTSNGLPC